MADPFPTADDGPVIGSAAAGIKFNPDGKKAEAA
jgi:hypothetical protein